MQSAKGTDRFCFVKGHLEDVVDEPVALDGAIDDD